MDQHLQVQSPSDQSQPNSEMLLRLAAMESKLQTREHALPTGTSPFGMAFDGANIWVAHVGSADVIKLRASDGAPLGTFPMASGLLAQRSPVATAGIGYRNLGAAFQTNSRNDSRAEAIACSNVSRLPGWAVAWRHA